MLLCFDGVGGLAVKAKRLPQIRHDLGALFCGCCFAVTGKGFDAPIIVVIFISQRFAKESLRRRIPICLCDLSHEKSP